MWSLITAGVKAAIGHLLAAVTRKPYWAMHPDMNLDAMASNGEWLAARVRELEESR